MLDRRLIQNFDWVLLLLVAALSLLSLTNLYSATFALRESGGSQVFEKQITWFLVGFGAFVVMTTFNYKGLAQIAYPLYFLSIALLLLVLLVGKVSSGSQRWLTIGPMTFQPSELAKMALLIVLAKTFSEWEPGHVYRLRDLWWPAVMLAFPCILILKEPDLGTALLLVFVGLSFLLVLRIRWQSLCILVGAGLALLPLLWMFLKEYQKMRIMTFLSPERDPLGAGYHINQSKIAIGSGALWGKGFLRGTQAGLHFLPEQHTDFAFSVLAEEWGFMGSLVLLSLYVLLVLRGLQIAKNSKDRFGAILAVGIVGLVFWQVIINVAMTTGLLPVVGIPLVLFSYGGSSLLTTMTALGLLASVGMRRFMFQ